jgi:hypothetical protein
VCHDVVDERHRRHHHAPVEAQLPRRAAAPPAFLLLAYEHGRGGAARPFPTRGASPMSPAGAAPLEMGSLGRCHPGAGGDARRVRASGRGACGWHRVCEDRRCLGGADRTRGLRRSVDGVAVGPPRGRPGGPGREQPQGRRRMSSAPTSGSSGSLERMAAQRHTDAPWTGQGDPIATTFA